MIQSHLEGILLVLAWEQLKLIPYKDAVGLVTVGYGHLVRPDEPDLRKPISRERANSLFISDFTRHEKMVLDALTRTLTPLQLGACVSLCFNIGGGAFQGSSVARRINAGTYDSVPDAFRMWNKAGGKVLRGLVERRESEVRLWLKGTPA